MLRDAFRAQQCVLRSPCGLHRLMAAESTSSHLVGLPLHSGVGKIQCDRAQVNSSWHLTGLILDAIQ